MLTHQTFVRQRLSIDPPNGPNYSECQIRKLREETLRESDGLVPKSCKLSEEHLIGPKGDVRATLFALMRSKPSSGFSFWAMGDAWEPTIELQSNFKA